MEEIRSEDYKIIEEEQSILDRLQAFAPVIRPSKNKADIQEQIAEISALMPEANEDDLSQLNDQLMRMNILLHQEEHKNEEGVNVNNPYFAHIRIKDHKTERDLYLGNQIYRSPDGLIQIIDWKISPIAMIYFLYEEGDEYEEEIDGRLFEGELALKRVLKVEQGELVRIQQGDDLLVKDSNTGWQRFEEQHSLLKGGSGSATRPDSVSSVDPKLGFDRQGNIRKDKLLPEITALIDPDQFELITKPESGIVAIQGTAGSGKTTVALHRAAWLYYRDPKRFATGRMMVMVFSKALSNYISMVLPSLGVHNVQTDYFENWASDYRKRMFQSRLPRRYCDRTPVNVIRFKKHPALLRVIDEALAEKENEFYIGLNAILEKRSIQNFPIVAFETLPFIARLYTLYEWVIGENQYPGFRFSLGAEASSMLERLLCRFIDPEKDRIGMVVHYWEELFTNFDHLKDRINVLTDNEFSDGAMAEIVEWQKRQYINRISYEKAAKPDLFEIMTDEDRADTNEPMLDYEDDSILLYYYQKLFKRLTRRGGSELRLTHLMIDEVQDMSAIELMVLLNTLDETPSVTLAGDVDQKMVEHGGFTDWKSMFSDLGLKGQAVSTLSVGYRSTYEIMGFAREVLGDLSSNTDIVSTRNGPPVELFHFSSQGELVYFVSKSLKELAIIEPNANTALICQSTQDSIMYYNLLKNMEIPDLRVVTDQDFPFRAGVDITDIKQVKGLEFDYVILLDADRINYPDNNYSKYLIHIGATRAAHQLWVINHKDPSPVIPASLVSRMIR